MRLRREWSFRRELRPVDVSGLARLGNPAGDGGYVVPLWLVESTDVLLTLGLGDDWSFDEDVRRIRPGALILGVDHTVHAPSVRSVAEAHVKSRAYRLLGRTTKASTYAELIGYHRRHQRLFKTRSRHIEKRVGHTASPTSVTIDELFALIGPIPAHRVLVSMDIEGAEYGVIEDILKHHTTINMIVTEFHSIGRHVEEFERSIIEMKESFDIVHLHGNNCAPYNHDLDIPEVVELTFVHRSLMPPDRRPSSAARPIPGLDVANDPASPDYVLNV